MSRFSCPSVGLELGMLFRKARHVLWIALGVAIALHGSLSQVIGLREQKSVVKPLTTQFIKRQPRLTKPLEMKKHPKPRRRRLQRKMVSVKARVDRQQVSNIVQPSEMIERLTRPSVGMSRITVLQSTEMEPEAWAQSIQGAKEPKHQVSLALEMLDIDALDTGEYHAMIVQDPYDKKSISGFFHLAVAYARSATIEENNYFPDLQALPNIVQAINKYTDIEADITDAFPLDSKELFKTPFIFITTHSNFDLTKSEALNLGKYMVAGGFVFADDCLPRIGSSGDLALRRMFKDALVAVGHEYGPDWDFERLPKAHAVYHCFFDFTAPPIGNDYHVGARGGGAPIGGGGPPGVGGPYPFLHGVTIDGRLVGIMSNKDIGCAWNDWPNQNPPRSNLRQLQFGVNLVIFALTQEGSITHRVMDTVR